MKKYHLKLLLQIIFSINYIFHESTPSEFIKILFYTMTIFGVLGAKKYNWFKLIFDDPSLTGSHDFEPISSILSLFRSCYFCLFVIQVSLVALGLGATMKRQLMKHHRILKQHLNSFLYQIRSALWWRQTIILIRQQTSWIDR